MEGGFQELLDEFLMEARERADEVESMLLELTTGDAERQDSAIAKAKRELHTLKGNSGMMGFSDLQQIAHTMEDQVEELDLGKPEIDPLLVNLDQLRRGLEAVRSPFDSEASDEAEGTPGAEAFAQGMGDRPTLEAPFSRDANSVRVPFSKIDRLVEGQAETLIFRNRLADSIARGSALVNQAEGLPHDLSRLLADAWQDVEHARETLEKTLGMLQEQVTELGMVPLQSLFRSLGRLVHDESRREGKSIDFEVRGGDTPIDKTLLEAAADALGHLVRNAIIHGIETPEKRRRKGKPEQGKVTVSATLGGDEVRIEVTDDGAGIDIAALRSKARNVAPELLATSSSDYALLFEDGISTRSGADIGAGRGVGLAAVKKSAESHGGRIQVRSSPRNGTTFTLSLPVTASILRSLLMRVDEEEYALPLNTVAESLALDPSQWHEMNQARVLRWRRRLVPILDIGHSFGTAPEIRRSGFVIVIDVNGRLRGLAIDSLVGIRDIVVKGLDKIVGNPIGISGSTILGDGRVIMILDPSALVSIPPTTVGTP